MSIADDMNPLGQPVQPYSAGTMLLYGDEDYVETINLNTKANLSYMFYGAQNIKIPEGVTFAGCTNATSMFAGAKNITLPDSATFENLTNASSMFSLVNSGTSGPFYNLSRLRFDKATNVQFLLINAQFDGNLAEATFEKATSCYQLFNACRALRSNDVLYLPKATFNSCTDDFSIVVWDIRFSRVFAPEATFKNCKGTRTSPYNSKNIKYFIPKATFESTTHALNKKTTPCFYCSEDVNGVLVMMTRLNLKLLSVGDGMFHGDGMDIETLESVAFGPADIRDPSNPYNTGIKRYTDGSSHTITLGIDSALYSEYNDGEPVSQLGIRVKNAIDEIRNRGWTTELEWNAPTVWQ